VLLNARMPERNGLTLAAMIRERTELSAMGLILLTSGDRPGAPARSLDPTASESRKTFRDVPESPESEIYPVYPADRAQVF